MDGRGDRGRSRIAVAGVVGSLVAAVAVAALVVPGGTGSIRGLADELAVPAGWELTAEVVEPPRLVCLGGNPCPSVSRRWSVGRNLDHGEFRELALSAGWDLAVDPDCDLRERTIGLQTACMATGTVDAYQVTVAHSGSVDDPSSANLRLHLRPAH